MEQPLTQRRFRTAAKYYLSGRSEYASLLIRRVVGLCALDRTQRILDLGCGPGQLAMAFAPFVREVTALDPEPEMLEIARRNASSGQLNIHFIQAGSGDLGPEFGRFQAVTIGRAFHWMDRAATLKVFDVMIEPEGAVVLFGDSHPEVPDNSWHTPYRQLVDRYAEGDSEQARRRSPEWLTHEAILLASLFNQMERISVLERRFTPIGRLTNRAFSFSSTAPQRLGAKANIFANEIRELMGTYALDGVVAEVVESTALIARRNSPSVSDRMPSTES
jgi:ubiquinone/menaquinone biosynthesis C-methylase UbiE